MLFQSWDGGGISKINKTLRSHERKSQKENVNAHRLKSDSTKAITKDKHISISDQNGVTGPALRCKQLENWTQYTKQLFSDIGQQSKTVI